MDILFKDKNFLVLNKPPMWIVNSAQTTKGQKVVQEWIEEQPWWVKTSDESDFNKRAGIVHRLDKETSGCLIVALNEESFVNLQAQFKERVVKKKYVALVHGKLKEEKGIIEVSVGRLPWRRDRFGILAGGRDSETKYKLISEYQKDKDFFTLVEFAPKTGRTHQIRIHAKYIGNPIVSDNFYAGRKTSRKDRKWCPRLFLHSSEISFLDPVTKKRINVEAPLPEDLQNVLSSFSE